MSYRMSYRPLRHPALVTLLAVGLCGLAFPLLLEAQEGEPASRPVPTSVATDPREVHLEDIVQLTAGGENAEAYWSPDGSRLVLQRSPTTGTCDQIFHIEARRQEDGSLPELVPVSNGEGRTTCAYFSYPGGERILYASTHREDPSCPPPPDRSQGYVWPLYDSYDILSTALDGSDPRWLTDTPGYDAEATVCPVDGRVIFTSTRDGDLDLYTMNADGSEVTRITDTPGYDGGAFFSPDCSKIVWRASRPQGQELEDYRRLLEQDLVRPSRLEIWTADADGSNPRQVTYFGAASFAPSFLSAERIIFSTNYGSDNGREFDLWAVNLDGSGLERITYTPDFDGFPLLSPDGEHLVFASNRASTTPGETNVFVARWNGEAQGEKAGSVVDTYRSHVAWLADDARAGRGVGTEGLWESAVWITERFAEVGLGPAGDGGTWFQELPVTVAVESLPETALALGGEPVSGDAFVPLAFSSSGSASGEVVAAGHGIVAPELGIDDYAGLGPEGEEVAGKIVAVRRFVPDPISEPEDQRRHGDLRTKARLARERGAVGLLVVDDPAEGVDEASLPRLTVDTGFDVGIPAMAATREAAGALLEGDGHRAELTVALERRTEPAHNVIGRLPPTVPEGDRLPGVVVLGAHYDHLGMGGSGSLAPDRTEPHNGADDNASGVAALIEAARFLVESSTELRREVLFVAFSGEESGLLGSTAFTRTPPGDLDLGSVVAMVNMDMVGRLRGNTLSILGGESAEEWSELVPPLCAEVGLGCTLSGDGYGPSDHTPFFASGIPVLHFFTGTHRQYHTPEDDLAGINAVGGTRIARLAAEVAAAVAGREEPLTLVETSAPAPMGDSRAMSASLGTIPDYVGPADGGPGMLLAGVREDGPAEQAGMRRGDILVELAGTEIRDIHDLMAVLQAAAPGDIVTAVVHRGDDREPVELTVTFGTSRRR